MAASPREKLVQLLVKMRGVTKDTDVLRGWILPDGRIVNLLEVTEGGEGYHEHCWGLQDVIMEAGYENRSEGEAMDLFMEETGSIRIADGGSGALLHLTLLPTPAQVDTAGKIARSHQLMEQEQIEIYFDPKDRLVAVSPITAGRVRRVLEALPGLPKG
jgi:hypothetical protein